MKKFIAAIDGLKFNESATQYAIYLAKHENAFLAGVFLDDTTYHSYKIYDLAGEEGVSETKLERLEVKDKKSRELATDHFEKYCRQAALDHSIHHDKGIAIRDLLHEGIYSDLLIINDLETFTHFEEGAPTRFIRSLLVNAECPVLIAPRKFRSIEKLILLFDGKPSSVYAIKQFSYILPFLKHLETEVISVKGMEDDAHVPDNALFKGFMKRHFPDAIYTVLKGIPEEEIVRHIKEDGSNHLIVLGAYRRGVVSRTLNPSMADTLMKELNAPLFIAHTK